MQTPIHRTESSPSASTPSLLTTEPGRAEHIAALLRALAHPIRIRIIAILCESEANVSELAERLGAKQAIVSQQLQILRTHRLVSVARENGFAVYRLAEQQLRQLVRCMEGCSIR